MTEKNLPVTLKEVISEAWHNKFFNIGIATGYTITAAASASENKAPATFKTLADIPITEIFSHDLSAQAAFGIAGGIYLIIKCLDGIKFFSFVAWAYRRLTGAK